MDGVLEFAMESAAVSAALRRRLPSPPVQQLVDWIVAGLHLRRGKILVGPGAGDVLRAVWEAAGATGVDEDRCVFLDLVRTNDAGLRRSDDILAFLGQKCGVRVPRKLFIDGTSFVDDPSFLLSSLASIGDMSDIWVAMSSPEPVGRLLPSLRTYAFSVYQIIG